MLPIESVARFCHVFHKQKDEGQKKSNQYIMFYMKQTLVL